MSGVLFLSNHASEIHSPNHRVLHVTGFCTARAVSALDFPGNRFTLSLFLSLNLWDYSHTNTTVHVFVVLPPITGAPVQLSTPETIRGMGTNFQCNDFWDRVGGHVKAYTQSPHGFWGEELLLSHWRRRLFLYYLLWNITSEFHKLKHMNYLLNAENLSQLISTLGQYFETSFIISCSGGTPLYKPYRYVPPPPLQRVWPLGLFGLKTGLHFASFGLESGMVFERTKGAYERIYRFNSKWIGMK